MLEVFLSCSLSLRVLPCGRIFLAVSFEFSLNGVGNVKAQCVGETQTIDDDIRELVRNLRQFFWVSQHLSSLLVGFPLKMLQELCGLNANRPRQVSRSIIFSPISTVSESCHDLHEFPNCRLSIHPRRAHHNRHSFFPAPHITNSLGKGSIRTTPERSECSSWCGRRDSNPGSRLFPYIDGKPVS